MADFTPEDVANRIWLRRSGEPRRAYGPLEVYLNLEGQRSLAAVAQALKDDPKAKDKPTLRTIQNYSSRYEWVKRACAYDAYMEEVAQQERERLRREREATWEARREQIKEDEFKTAEKLRDVALQMLAVPLFEVKEEVQDGEDCVVKITLPAGWRMRDAFRAAEVYSRLARLSADMATDREELSIDIPNASDADLDTIIAQGRKR